MAIIFTLIVLYLENALKNVKQCIISLLFIAGAIYYGYFIASVISIWPQLLSFIIPVGIFLLTILICFFPSLASFKKPVQTYYPLKSISRYFINLVADAFLNSYFIAIAVFIIVIVLNTSSYVIHVKLFSIFLFVLMAFMFRRSLLCVIYQQADLFSKKLCIFITIVIMLIASILVVKHNMEIIWSVIGSFILLIGGFLIEEMFTFFPQRKVVRYRFFNHMRLQMQFNNSKFLLHYTMLVIVLSCFLFVTSYTFHKKGVSDATPLIYLSYFFVSPLIVFTYILNNLFGFFDNYWLDFEKRSSNGKVLFMHYIHLAVIPITTELILLIIFLFINPGQLRMALLLHLGTLPILLVLGFYWSVLFPKKVSASFLTFDTPTGILPTILSIIICLSFAATQVNKWFTLLVAFYLGIAIILFFNIEKFYKKNKYLLFQKLFKQ